MNKFISTPENGKFWDFYRDGISQSLIQKFLSCRQQCRLEYYEGWTKVKQPLFFKFGTCVHWVLAEIYNEGVEPTKDHIIGLIRKYERNYFQKNVVDAADQKELDEIFMMAELILEKYFIWHDKDFHHKWMFTERNFEVPFGDTKLRGRWDGGWIENKRLCLVDHKCLSMIDEEGIADMLPLDMQVLVYCYAALVEFGIMPYEMNYNIVRRPGFRQGKKTDEEFRQHIICELNKKLNYYFIRIPIRITKDELLFWVEHQLKPIVAEIQRWFDGGCESFVTPGSLITKYGRCSMFGAITKNDYSGLVKRQYPFEELDGEDA